MCPLRDAQPELTALERPARLFSPTRGILGLLRNVNVCTSFAAEAFIGLSANSPSSGDPTVSVRRFVFKWAAVTAVAAAALFAAASASAQVSWSIGIGAPAFYEPAPVYAAPPPVYYQPAPRVYYRPPPVYYRPGPVYYGPPPVYYGPDYRSEYRDRHHNHRDRDDHDD